jgi:hypothetical protein
VLQPAFLGRDEDRAAQAFQDTEILIPLAGQASDVLGQGFFAGRAHGPGGKHGLGGFVEEIAQDGQQGVGIRLLRALPQMLVIRLAAQGEQTLMQLQGHACFVMAPSDLSQLLEAGVDAVVVAPIKLTWSCMRKPGRQGVIDPLDGFGPGSAHRTGLIGEAVRQGKLKNGLHECVALLVQQRLQAFVWPIHGLPCRCDWHGFDQNPDCTARRSHACLHPFHNPAAFADSLLPIVTVGWLFA